MVPRRATPAAPAASVAEPRFPDPSADDGSCLLPVAEDDGVCQPRVRRRLVSVGPLATGSPQGELAARAARRLATRHVTLPDPEAAVDYVASTIVSCILLHTSGPLAGALDTLTKLTAAHGDVPVVVLGDQGDPAVAVAAAQAGAQDYVLADGVDELGLERAIRQAIDRHRTRAQLRRMALHDQLTGVANRTAFADRLEHALARRAGGAVAVLFIDIDGFKRVNDHLGHGAGDQALRDTARRMQSALRPSDTLARFGGDTFTILCEGLDGDAGALAIAERIASHIGLPLELAGAEVVLRASVGVAVDAGRAMAADELMHAADQAMYEAKHRGGGRAELWRHRDRGEGNEIQLEAELRRSIPGGLRAVYQPQVLLEDGTAVGAEALVRWEHPERGIVSPGEFIPIAERSGLVVPLGRWILQEACAECARLGELTGRPLRMSVNVSGRQMADERLIADVESALAASSLPAGRLQLELTESTLIEDLDAGVALVERLKTLGVSIALDDFGTGYSSLSYLKRLPVDTIKIDRTFVSGLPDSREDLAIIAAVMAFGRALGMTVLAEGVETEAQVETLLELGCSQAQGFYFHRPVGAPELRALLVE